MYEVILIFGGFIACALYMDWRDNKGCKHQWEKWSDPLTQETRTSFHSANKAYQVRICSACNESESRTISEVRT